MDEPALAERVCSHCADGAYKQLQCLHDERWNQARDGLTKYQGQHRRIIDGRRDQHDGPIQNLRSDAGKNNGGCGHVRKGSVSMRSFDNVAQIVTEFTWINKYAP